MIRRSRSCAAGFNRLTSPGVLASVLIILACLSSLLVSAQQPYRSPVRLVFHETLLIDALKEVSVASGVNVVFSPDLIPDRKISMRVNDNLNIVLVRLLYNTGLTFRDQDGQIILFKDPEYNTPFNVSGYVEEVGTGERLYAAHIYDMNSGEGTITNEYGFFTIQARGKKALLRVSYLGFKYDTIEVDKLAARNTQQVQLDRFLLLKEVVIRAEQNERINLEPLSKHRFSDQDMMMKPYLGGELDIQRYLETQPGVSIGTDGIGGMHVRGGNGDQNLMLLDGVPVYHSTHAIGILSVFNPLMIREVTLMKGEFPARYAGRLSSVLDVKTREGSNKQWSLQASLGPTSANALIEGPIVKDKIGILVTARRFLPGFYLRNLSMKEKESNELTGYTEYGFSDVNAKCNISLTKRDRIYLSYYRGDDHYSDTTNKRTSDPESVLSESFKRDLNWGNNVGILRWNHQFGLHLFANTTFTLSSFELQSIDNLDFNQQFSSQVIVRGFTHREFKSRIKDAGVRFDLDHWINNRNRLRYGINFTNHRVSPKSIVFDDAAQIDDFWIDEDEGTLDDGLFSELITRANEAGVYLEDYNEIGSAIELSAGAHLSAFNIRDKIYWSLQPRVSIGINMLDNLRGHVSANKMTQYMHLLTSSGIGLPTDLWVPSTETIKPEHAYQVSTGLTWQATDRLKIQSDVYYRSLRNLIAYQEGASFLFREGSVQTGIVDAANWEDKVTQGSGKAYGVESMISFEGKWYTTELAYTYGHSKRHFEDLNFGKSFDFRFDRRHAVSVSGALQITEQFMVSLSWNYASGIPITLAESKFLHPSSSPIFPPVEVLEFSEYNAFRLPSYHRLDIGARYSWKKPKATHSLHLDIYNAYDRSNVLYITLVQDGDGFRNQRFTVLPFIPSLSYQLKI